MMSSNCMETETILKASHVICMARDCDSIATRSLEVSLDSETFVVIYTCDSCRPKFDGGGAQVK